MLWKNQRVGIEIEYIKRPCFIDADTEQRRLEIDERVYTASEQGKNQGWSLPVQNSSSVLSIHKRVTCTSPRIFSF